MLPTANRQHVEHGSDEPDNTVPAERAELALALSAANPFFCAGCRSKDLTKLGSQLFPNAASSVKRKVGVVESYEDAIKTLVSKPCGDFSGTQ